MLLTLALSLSLPLFALADGDSSDVLNQSSNTTQTTTQSEAPVSYDQIYEQARSAAHAGKYREAIETYSDLLERFPDDVDGLLGRGLAYAWSQQYDLAETDFNRVLVLAPEYADAWAARGNLYLWTGRTEQALADHQRWAKLAPDNPEAPLTVAREQIELRQFTKARTSLEAAEALGASEAVLSQLTLLLNRTPQATNWEVWGGIDRMGIDKFPGGIFDETGIDLMLLGIRGKLPRGSIGIEVHKEAEPGLNAQFITVDLWHDLPMGFYTNTRIVTRDFGQGVDYRNSDIFNIDIYRPIARNAEFVAGIALSDKSEGGNGGGLDGGSAGIGYYSGPFYLSGKLSYNNYAENDAFNGLFRLRFYFGNVDRYGEVSLSKGSEEFYFSTERMNTDVQTLFVHYFFTQHIGAEFIYSRFIYTYNGYGSYTIREMIARAILRF